MIYNKARARGCLHSPYVGISDIPPSHHEFGNTEQLRFSLARNTFTQDPTIMSKLKVQKMHIAFSINSSPAHRSVITY